MFKDLKQMFFSVFILGLVIFSIFGIDTFLTFVRSLFDTVIFIFKCLIDVTTLYFK